MECYYCHTEQPDADLVDTGYYDPISKHDTIVSGCRDIEACLDRQPKYKYYPRPFKNANKELAREDFRVDQLIANTEGK